MVPKPLQNLFVSIGDRLEKRLRPNTDPIALGDDDLEGIS